MTLRGAMAPAVERIATKGESRTRHTLIGRTYLLTVAADKNMLTA
jgi:hypothetical protein